VTIPESPSEPITNFTANTTTTTSTTESNITTSPPEKSLEKQRLLARGAGIFNFSDLIVDNCNDFIVAHVHLIDQTEEDVGDLEQDFERGQHSLDEALSDLRTAQQIGDNHAADRAKREVDREQERVDATEDELENTVEYLRKLKLILSTMREECTKLRARA